VPEIVVASFNAHCGVDGWGRPFDVEAACRRIDADVLVLQEAWTPDDGEGLADRVGRALGYTVTSHALARCRLLPPVAAEAACASWGPTRRSGLRPRRGMVLRPPRFPGPPDPPGDDPGDGRMAPWTGTWDLAVLTREPPARVEVVDLGRLRHDVARRVALAVDVVAGGRADRPVTVVGLHMSHLSAGSPVQYRRLARLLPPPHTDTVVAGDMNLWGPPLSAMLPGYRRVVRGRTWPSWRPVVQSDHILATPRLRAATQGEVLDISDSDHLPVRARFRLDG
jgi:endonuclease/exonuclease/phosphatase family metal-dependent hydrolase